LTFADFAQKCEIVPDSQSFKKLYLAIPESWDGGELSSNDSSNDC